MIRRKLDKKLFRKTTFLLGPRKVGKSTYLKMTFPDSLYIDFLDNDLYFEYTKTPGKFYQQILYQISVNPQLAKRPIIIDEIQRLPLLLNEVHRLIESKKLNFILCGSSARKLVRGGANMLGGRASRIEMRGLAIKEITSFNLLKFVNQGGIPSHYLSNNAQQEIKAYIQNYLQEEIKNESLVRNLQSFHQFLELVGITNTEEVNYTNIARDVGVNAKTIKEYFQILIDTLVGTYLEPFFDKQKRSNVLRSPKFYFFDNGIINYLKGLNIKKEIGTEFGKAFEQAIYLELLNYKNFKGKNFVISFWRTYEQNEVDFILGNAEVALEVKSSSNVQNRDLKNLFKFKDIYQPKKCIVVTNEKRPRLLKSGIKILPYMEFVELLWKGEII